MQAEKTVYRQLYYLLEEDIRRVWTKTNYDHLNLGRKRVLRISWLLTEMNNGGITQYLWNSVGEYTHETIIDLADIGAIEASEVLIRAVKTIAPTSRLPNDLKSRREVLIQYCGTHPFNDDDNKERIALLNVDHMDKLETLSSQLMKQEMVMVDKVTCWAYSNMNYFDKLKRG